MAGENFDHIVIGAGSAGCAVAGRLAEDRANRVLLLEAGGRGNPLWTAIPGGIAHLLSDPSCQWGFETVAQQALGGRRLPIPQGRIIGGTSAINGMLYVRGNARDYDDWAAAGCAGWSYDDVLPWFLKAEGNRQFVDRFHGATGPLAVSAQRQLSNWSHHFVAAALEAGLPYRDDFNGAGQDGAGLFQATIESGQRCSAARAYLPRRVRGQSNLAIRRGALVQRILIEDGRAIGVEYRRRGRLERTMAAGGIVLSGGAFNSPRLLMLSGIGPAEELAALGIEPKVDSAEVGRNLQDHVSVPLVAEVGARLGETGGTYDGQESGLAALRHGLRYLLGRSGPAASVGWEAGAFLRSGPGLDRPNIEMHFIPYGLDQPERPRPAITFNVSNLRPFSRGTVRLQSADPSCPPLIDPAWLSDTRDLAPLRAGIGHALRIAAQPSLAPHILKLDAPSDVDSYIRARAGSDFHFGGTCRMGGDERSVVDERLRVRGLSGLRIADCSIMPRVPGGNTNAAAIMIGERCAAFIES